MIDNEFYGVYFSDMRKDALGMASSKQSAIYKSGEKNYRNRSWHDQFMCIRNGRRRSQNNHEPGRRKNHAIGYGGV
jgi:hypothetical protein